MIIQGIFTLILLAVAIVIAIKLWGSLFVNEVDKETFDIEDADLDLAEKISRKQEELNKLRARKAQLESEVIVTEEMVTVSQGAERADQEAKTREAEGKAKLMEVRYQQLQNKERAVIEAEKNKEVAELDAAKRLEVAKLDARAAEQEKIANIKRGEGESEYKKLVMVADGALKQKLEAWMQAQEVWARAYASRQVPSVFMSGAGDNGTGGPDNQFTTFMNMLNAKTAKDLSLDMTVKGNQPTE